MLQKPISLEDKEEKGKGRNVLSFVVVYQTKVALDTISSSFECLLAIKRTIINTNNLNETVQNYRLNLLYSVEGVFYLSKESEDLCTSTFETKLVVVKKIDALRKHKGFLHKIKLHELEK